MRLSVVFVFVLVLIVFGYDAASAQAFGFKMGASPASISGAEIVDQTGPLTTYSVKNAPVGHSEFESYAIVASKKNGICKVMGIGKNHVNDSYGVSIKTVFAQISKSLKEKYTGGEEYDFLHAGSIWNEPRDFAMSLRQNERSLALAIDRSNAANLTDDIENIMLSAKTVSSSTTYLTLSYEFRNFQDCLAERDDANSSGL